MCVYIFLNYVWDFIYIYSFCSQFWIMRSQGHRHQPWNWILDRMGYWSVGEGGVGCLLYFSIPIVKRTCRKHSTSWSLVNIWSEGLLFSLSFLKNTKERQKHQLANHVFSALKISLESENFSFSSSGGHERLLCPVCFFYPVPTVCPHPVASIILLSESILGLSFAHNPQWLIQNENQKPHKVLPQSPLQGPLPPSLLQHMGLLRKTQGPSSRWLIPHFLQAIV